MNIYSTLIRTFMSNKLIEIDLNKQIYIDKLLQ